MKDRDLKSLFERLTTRGTPRGAASVFEAAQTRAGLVRSTERSGASLRRYAPLIAIAASVSLVGAVAAAIAVNHDSSGPQFAAHGLNTVPPSSTTAPIPEVSIPAKLIAASRLVPFSNCGTFTSYMRTKGLQYVSPYGLPSMGGYRGGPVAMGRASGTAEMSAGPSAADSKASPSPALAATGPDEFSSTNVQEAGIDEPDVVKTDGKRIYALANGKFFVVDAANPRILDSLDVGYATEMFVVGDRAVVFTNTGNGPQPMMDGGVAASSASPSQYPYRQQVRIITLDVANPAAIKEVSHLDVDGSYVSARLVNGVARVVISSYSNMQFAYPTDGTPAAQDAALQKNRDIVRNAKFGDWVPHYTVTNAAGKTSAARPAVACGDAYRPPQFSGFGQLSVMSLDPRNPTAAKTTTVTADGQTVYGSATRLYVATTQWGDVRPAAGGAMPMVIAPAAAKTLIHDFDISDPAQASYRVSGVVRGTVLNQFSFSEYEGNLRVATTDGDQSYVTVLADQGKILAQIGQVGGLGQGERIYAVRFIGPLGYVVTFRQVDPLYVIDLRVPTRPRVVGELKVLGYSAYLHPVSDTLLIGVGQDATPEGRRAGTQVSLFDVSNPAAPRLLQRLPLGYGNSQAEYDHHAFLYWAAKQLAVIPLQEYEPNKGGPGFMGAVGMHVVPSEIREVGRVTHTSSNYGGMIERSMVIGGRLFTYSGAGIKASDLDTFADRAWVPFPQPQPEPQPAPQPEPAPPSSSGGANGSPA